MNHEPADAHLRAALHHAPGHDAAPPAALDARVLARARAATSAPWWRRLVGAADSLMQPAPAAVLATLVMATTIGLMWRGEVPAEAPPTAPPVTASPAPAPTTPVAAVSATSAARAPTPTPTPRAVVAAKRAAPAASATPAPAPEKLTRDEAVSPSVAATAPITAAAPPALANTTERSETRARAAPARAAAVTATPPVTFDPLAHVAQAMATDDTRRAGMRELQQASLGRWQRVPMPAAESSKAVDIKDTRGRTMGLLHLDDSAAWWWALDGGVWRAELPAPELASIRARLGKGG